VVAAGLVAATVGVAVVVVVVVVADDDVGGGRCGGGPAVDVVVAFFNVCRFSLPCAKTIWQLNGLSFLSLCT
jgi:hypothetical protein